MEGRDRRAVGTVGNAAVPTAAGAAGAVGDAGIGAGTGACADGGIGAGADEKEAAFRSIIAANPVFLAPMAGWTDVVFRTICKRMGAGLTYTEMVSAQGLAHGSAKTGEYLEISDEEGRAAAQLFGNDPDVMARQAELLCEKMGGRLAAIDINMGCPARKVVRKGEGSALMTTPDLACKIVERMVAVSDVPVTVKFRRGFERGDETAVDFALAMEAAGASAICVHGRYSRDFYHGTADWDVIARAREAVRIPVIASGDLMSAKAVAACFAYTGVDAVMIARGAQGNPWIFAQTAELLGKIAGQGEGAGAGSGAGAGQDASACGDAGSDSGAGAGSGAGELAASDGEEASAGFSISDWEPQLPTLEERIRVARMHVRMLAERDPRTCIHMRNYFSPYFKGVPGAASFRGQVTSCTTLEDFERFFDRIWEEALDHGYVPADDGGYHVENAAAPIADDAAAPTADAPAACDPDVPLDAAKEDS